MQDADHSFTFLPRFITLCEQHAVAISNAVGLVVDAKPSGLKRFEDNFLGGAASDIVVQLECQNDATLMYVQLLRGLQHVFEIFYFF